MYCSSLQPDVRMRKCAEPIPECAQLTHWGLAATNRHVPVSLRPAAQRMRLPFLSAATPPKASAPTKHHHGTIHASRHTTQSTVPSHAKTDCDACTHIPRSTLGCTVPLRWPEPALADTARHGPNLRCDTRCRPGILLQRRHNTRKGSHAARQAKAQGGAGQRRTHDLRHRGRGSGEHARSAQDTRAAKRRWHQR